MTPDRRALVAEALSWLGTPYAHHQRLKGAGVDCAQLPLAIYQACGWIAPEVETGLYPAQWHLHRGEELYLARVAALGGRERTTEEAEPGDLLVWRYGRAFSHGGLLLDGGRIVHAVRGAGVVLGDLHRDEALRTRAARAFSLPPPPPPLPPVPP